MRIHEVIRNDELDVVDLLIEQELHDQIRQVYDAIINEIEYYPNLLICDIFGDRLSEIRRHVYRLHTSAKALYPSNSASIKRTSQLLSLLAE